MKGIERAPFAGKWEKIGPPTTADSVAVKVTHNSSPRDAVVRWSRVDFASAAEAYSSCEYIRKAVALYEKAFGDNYIVPTDTIVGQKKDGPNNKYKVYLFQPFISGWEGTILPDLICQYPEVSDQWQEVASKMLRLIRIAKEVNQGYPNEGRFPINLTIGTLRRSAKTIDGDNDCPIPSSPNVIVEKDTLRIKLFDFGTYTQWRNEMLPTYQQIWRMV